MLHLQLLGGAVVDGGEQDVNGPLAQRHQIGLLALLATALRNTLSRDKLIGLLWPESDTKHARNLLNVAVYSIRKALGEDSLLSVGDGIQLNGTRWRVDVAEFEAALAAGDLERAAALYAGPFLDGFFISEAAEFERWLDGERIRLQKRMAGAAWALAEAAERGQSADAGALARRAAELLPYDENAHRRLLEFLDRAGDRAGALEAHQHFRKRLAEDLAVQPAPETRAVVAMITARDAPRSIQTKPPDGQFDSSRPLRDRPAPLAPKLALVAAGSVVVLSAAALLVFGAGRGATGDAGPIYRRTAIAVLPFRNLSVDPSHAYFAGGLHDELLTQLSKLAGLTVTSRQSVTGYASTSRLRIKQIATELEVGSVVEGSVQVLGNRLRVTAQLIDANTDAHIWAEHYDRTLDDAFAIQSDVARQIVGALGAAITNAEARALAAPHTTNPEAYRLYLQGREYFTRDRSRQQLDIAQLCFERALMLDPRFALARAALSDVHGAFYIQRLDRSPGRAARQRAEAEAALRLAPNLPQAHFAMGSWHYQARGDYPRALGELRIALDALPNDAEVWARIAQVTRRMGNWKESVAAHEKTAQLNPRSASHFKELGLTYMWMRRYSEAATAFDRASSLAPELFYPRLMKGLAYVHWHGQLDTLRAVLRSSAWSDTAGDGTKSVLELLYWDRLADSMVQIARTARTGVFEGQNFFVPAALYTAWAHQLRGDRPAERDAFDSARVFLDSAIREHADDERVHAALGLALGGVGRREEALREARWLQLSAAYREDRFQGGAVAENRARILVKIGDGDAALDEIESLLARPSHLSVHTLELDPGWDPIRTHARFRALLAKYASR